MTRKLNGLPPIIGKMPKTLIRPLADLARCQTSAEAIAGLLSRSTWRTGRSTVPPLFALRS